VQGTFTFGSSFAAGRGRIFGTLEALYRDAIQLTQRDFSRSASMWIARQRHSTPRRALRRPLRARLLADLPHRHRDRQQLFSSRQRHADAHQRRAHAGRQSGIFPRSQPVWLFFAPRASRQHVSLGRVRLEPTHHRLWRSGLLQGGLHDAPAAAPAQRTDLRPTHGHGHRQSLQSLRIALLSCDRGGECRRHAARHRHAPHHHSHAVDHRRSGTRDCRD
jgi:hypothetical protein